MLDVYGFHARITRNLSGDSRGCGRRKLGAIIADGVHTGINTSIYPGRKMWPHTMTLPGAVVKEDVVSET